MNHAIRYVVAFSGLSLLSIIQPAYAEYKCDQKFLTRVDTKACAAAAEGADSLRRFVSQTQRIYHLQMSDYARFEHEVKPASAAHTAVAKAQKPATSATVPGQ